MRKAKADKAEAVKAEKAKAKAEAEALPVSVQRNGKKSRAKKETIINNYYYSEPKAEPEVKPVLTVTPSPQPIQRPAVPPTPKRNVMTFF